MTGETVLIFGFGGHARVIASLLDRPSRLIDKEEEDSVFADKATLLNTDIYVGLGDNTIRERIFNRLSEIGVVLPPLVATGAFVSRGAQIGRGAVILPGAVVMTGTRVGDNCIIDLISSVDHDCVVGAHTFIGPGVSIPGHVVIGSRCFFGVKSATFPNVKIGDGVVVRAGSLVTKDVEAGAKVGGVPAVKIVG